MRGNERPCTYNKWWEGKPLTTSLCIWWIRARITEVCIVRHSSCKLRWIVSCFLWLPRNPYFELAHSQIWEHDSPIQGGNHLNFTGDVLLNNKITLGAQILPFQHILASSLLSIELKITLTSLALKFLVLLPPDPRHPCCGSSQQDVLIPSDKLYAYQQDSVTLTSEDRAPVPFLQSGPKCLGKVSSCLPLPWHCVRTPFGLPTRLALSPDKRSLGQEGLSQPSGS